MKRGVAHFAADSDPVALDRVKELLGCLPGISEKHTPRY
jgi:hypothetical protein